jgi:ADP-ribose pyrophosphatase YjhB (NUDIX family)
MEPQWLGWARQLQALAQTGLTYATNPYDIERYHALHALAVEMLAAGSATDPAQVRGWFPAGAGHPTPKLDVRGVVFRGDTLLLVRERSEGLWTLPGGWVDVGEPPSRAVEREVWEESGLRTRAVKLLALYDRARHPHPPHPHHIYKLCFRCELVGGAPTLSHETDGVGFFAPSALPPLSLGRILPSQIARLCAHRDHPDWPTDFD